MGFKSEADLAANIVAFLEDEGWEVYQEVEPRRFGATADIVATQGRIVWAIECKLSMSFELLGQALSWRGYAHRISVAVPAPKRSRNNNRDAFVYQFCKDHGIGWLEGHTQDWGWNHNVNERLRAQLNRRLVDHRIRDSLSEKHKTFAKAGTNDRKRWTPFQNTCDQIRGFVRQNPGSSLKEIIDAVDHHYASNSSARSSISHWVQAGKIKGLEAKREGKYLKFYAKPLKDD